MKMQVPKEWLEDTERFGKELVTVETIKGQKITIPKKLLFGWENIKRTMDGAIEDGQDPLESLYNHTYSLHAIILGEIYLEIYRG